MAKSVFTTFTRNLDFEKGVIIYFGTMGLLGFKRGVSGKFDENSVFFYNKEKRSLYVEHIGVGLLYSLYYMNPMFHIPIIYGMLRRTEKRIRGMPLVQSDWYE
jgi:hypothetical protein